MAHYRSLAILLLLLCAFALRLYRLDFQDIWWDEGRNIDVASRSLAVIATAKEMDIHPPLYFYTLHLWMLGAGRSEFAVRFLSVFFSLLTIPLFYRFGAAMGTHQASSIIPSACWQPPSPLSLPSTFPRPRRPECTLWPSS